MKNNPTLKSLLLAASVALSLGLTARADSTPPPDVRPAAAEEGLLGQSFATLTYSYVNFDDTSVHGDDYTFTLNQPLSFGLDGYLSYDYAETGNIAGSSIRQNALGAGLKAFSAAHNWGKPYAQAGAGYAWTRYAGTKDNSFFWEAAVGAEFAVARATTITPYVKYVDIPDIANGDSWNFGAKANYWVDSAWAVTAGVEIDNDENTTFTIGTNFHF
jgi:hypothetical protein